MRYLLVFVMLCGSAVAGNITDADLVRAHNACMQHYHLGADGAMHYDKDWQPHAANCDAVLAEMAKRSPSGGTPDQNTVDEVAKGLGQ